jgi:PhzF family phenazine biosynthesis protein
MKQRAFKQVDVFTDRPYYGNPLAVVLDGSGLTTEEMQHFTNWTNLSECTFLLPPTHASADYRVRIFCPGRELPFAGHPTLGTCHAWLEAGGIPRASGVAAGKHTEDFIVQECGIGLVKIQRDGARLAFAAPPLLKSGPLEEADVALIALGLGVQRSDILAHAWCDNGPKWRGVMLQSAEQVLALKPDARVLAGLDVGVIGPRGKVGVIGSHVDGHETQFEVRAFFPGNNGMTEDPVTGSLNAALAQWLIGAGIAPPNYVAAQGTALARAGRVHVRQEGESIWIGGASVTCVDGVVSL